MTGLYRKLLGHPFVYDQVRPRVVGGIDMRPLYDLLAGEAFIRDNVDCFNQPVKEACFEHFSVFIPAGEPTRL